ncbi:MAG TPA: type II toxin-antitoxin system prevent-host-death family antitoxin [Solirubrobacterales bacterium]|nr:type II toxin-antitoxin system prevent-host-death family antitoxin [Solirubrobacterales bacterium]
MKQLSATDAARKFSDVLDSVESDGESFVVVRHGRAVATIGPAVAGTGRALKEALRNHPPDPEWASELRELREAVGPPADPWRD